MLSGHRSASRRRGRAARIAIPLAIPVALGLTLGIVLAVSNGGATNIAQSALGTCASASASPAASAPAVAASAPAAAASASAAPCTSASPAAPAAASATATAAAAAVAPAPSNANGQVAFRQLGNLANAPVDGAGNALSLNQTAAQAAASGTCTITAPANPLSAQGLATPWVLGDGCSMANAAQEAFVEATIVAPNGSVQVYNPLVITQGTTPAATPVAPTIARGSQVIIDGGFNGTNLVVLGNGARRAGCVDALGQSVIGQVFACNAVNFYRMANALIARGTLVVPPSGTATDGQACLTVRDFGAIDQDQSDNVITGYLLNGNGQTAQNTAANAAAVAGSAPIFNGSDDKLVAAFLDPANGCTPFTATDATSPNGTDASQALNELSARVNQKGTIAVVPPNDEMTLVAGAMSIAKTNVYRSLVDQPLLAGNASAATVASNYCQNMVNIQPARNQLDMTAELNFTTPVAAVGNSLATFMGNRLNMSFTNLGCNNFGLTNPATVTLDGNQVATAVTYNVAQQQATAQAAAGGGNGTANPPARGHRKGRHFQNPSGM